MSNSHFSTKKLITLAILSALGSALMWIEIPFIPPFRLDPSDSAVIVAAVLYGPIGAVVVAAIKSLSHFIFISSGDFGIGEFIAFTASLAYAIPFYYSMLMAKKMRANAILVRFIPMVIGTLGLTIILPLLNYLVFFQLYSYVVYNKFGSHEVVLAFALGSILGNVVKGAGLSAIFFILSLRLENVAEKLSDSEFGNLELLKVEA